MAGETKWTKRLVGAAVAAALGLGTGCGGVGARGELSEEDLAVGEAASALIISEEEGDGGAGDSIAFTSEAELDEQVSEQAEPPSADLAQAPAFCDFDARRQQVLAHYDADGSGKLERTELQALRADLASRTPGYARLTWRFRSHAFRAVRWAFDEDGDRQLSADERTAMIDALEARCERRRQAVIDRFDANGDGQLDAGERQAARAAFEARLQQRRAAILAAYDADGNGQLDTTERQALRADLAAKAQARRQALIARFDVNGNGQLDPQEAQALRLAIQERIRSGGDGEEA